MATVIKTRKHLGIDATMAVALGIVPALAAATDLASAVVLTSGIITAQVGTIALLRVLRRFVVPGMHQVCATVVAGGITALWAQFAHALFPVHFTALTVYAYLIPAMLPVLLASRTIAPSPALHKPARRVVMTGLLACATLCSIAALREMIGSGTVLGFPLFASAPVRWTSTSSGSLALAALVFALLAAARRFVFLKGGKR